MSARAELPMVVVGRRREDMIGGSHNQDKYLGVTLADRPRHPSGPSAIFLGVTEGNARSGLRRLPSGAGARARRPRRWSSSSPHTRASVAEQGARGGQSSSVRAMAWCSCGSAAWRGSTSGGLPLHGVAAARQAQSASLSSALRLRAGWGSISSSGRTSRPPSPWEAELCAVSSRGGGP